MPEGWSWSLEWIR